MNFTLESTVECTVDGVGLLEPGKPVAVDIEMFKMYHGVGPAQANFPPNVTVTFDLSEDGKGE